MKKQNYEMYPETYVRLLALIREFAAQNRGDRLPTEEQLAAQLGVSRVKIRDVLAMLEAAGYVIRKRGVGTLINRVVLAEAARLDVDSIYVEIVSSYGFKPKSTLRSLKRLDTVSETVSDKLRLEAGEAVYLFEKGIYADDRPVILVADYIPARIYESVPSDLSLMDTNIFFFLQTMCDELLETLIVHMDACAAQGELAAAMEVPQGCPLLKLDSVCYTQRSEPVMYSVEYYNSKIIPFSFQKRVLSGKFNRSLPPDGILPQ